VSPCGGVARLGDDLLDLVPALRERLDHLARDPVDLGVAVADRTEANAQPRSEAVPELCLIEVAGGVGVVVDRATVDGLPPPLRRASEVGAHDVGVEKRVAGAARPVIERSGDDAVSLDPAAVAGRPTGEAGVSLVVGDDGIDRVAVRVADRLASLLVGDRPQHRDALWAGAV
jgi:hypothetical protein